MALHEINELYNAILLSKLRLGCILLLDVVISDPFMHRVRVQTIEHGVIIDASIRFHHGF